MTTRIQAAASTVRPEVILISIIDEDGDADVTPMTRAAAFSLIEQLRAILSTTEAR